jgi:hypothetical protein
MPLEVLGAAAEQLGDAEVAHLGLPVGAQQDVGRLEVAVDDALLVGVLHGAGDGLQPLGGLARRLRAAGQALRQAAA